MCLCPPHLPAVRGTPAPNLTYIPRLATIPCLPLHHLSISSAACLLLCRLHVATWEDWEHAAYLRAFPHHHYHLPQQVFMPGPHIAPSMYPSILGLF